MLKFLRKLSKKHRENKERNSCFSLALLLHNTVYRYCKSFCCRIWLSNLAAWITSETELNVAPNEPRQQYKPKRYSPNYFVTLLSTTESCFHWRDLENREWLPVLFIQCFLCNHFSGACMKSWSSRWLECHAVKTKMVEQRVRLGTAQSCGTGEKKT